MPKVAESTVRRLSLYLRFLEEFEGQGIATVSSSALASRGGTTSAQVRKDLSFFGSFGKRGLISCARSWASSDVIAWG
jgi:redox-sensing transcriptional repressor